MRQVTILLAGMAILAATGCDRDNNCYFLGGADRAQEAQPLRNPETGLCEYFGGGGGGGGYICEDDGDDRLFPAGEGDSPPPEPTDGTDSGGTSGAAALEAWPAWGTCYGACEGLDESSCMAAPGCQAGHRQDCPSIAECKNGDDSSFFECWEVSPGGGIGVECEALQDAYSCSTRDDCVKVHYPNDYAATGGEADEAVPVEPPPIGNFARCESEPPGFQGCYGDEECGPGYDCTADTECLPPPGCGDNGDGEGACPAVCYGRCVPLNDPGTCDGDVSCESLPPPCEPGTTPGRKDGCWTGVCIPDNQCGGPGDPGLCYGQPACDSEPPACPDGTLAGHDNSCWTGYCIPTNMCEAPPSCASLSTEDQCIAQDALCAPLYEGGNCTCNGDQCTCTELVFTSCKTRN